VTRGALAAIGAFGELTVVRVFMAVHAFLEGKRLLEISTSMALRAIDSRVLPQQRKLCPGVVKVLAYSLNGDLLPSAGVVACLAALGEAAAVWILMAIGTLIERNPYILRFTVGSIRVAFRALYLRMQPGQRILRLRVIELRDTDLLPVNKVVARFALRSQATFVLIFVAG
jgi:hypothetical protein